jgi:hypothetical protein
VLDGLDYPMFIATVPGDGCLVGFATQCSIDPVREEGSAKPLRLQRAQAIEREHEA